MLQTKQDCCSVAANPPPPRGSVPGQLTNPGMPLVATQQPDKALHNTNLSRWSLGCCKRVQALDDISY